MLAQVGLSLRSLQLAGHKPTVQGLATALLGSLGPCEWVQSGPGVQEAGGGASHSRGATGVLLGYSGHVGGEVAPLVLLMGKGQGQGTVSGVHVSLCRT